MPQPRRDLRPATKEDIQVMLLSQLVTVNNMYRALEADRTRLMKLCKAAGVTTTKIRETIKR